MDISRKKAQQFSQFLILEAKVMSVMPDSFPVTIAKALLA
jgi:hypothetical protein